MTLSKYPRCVSIENVLGISRRAMASFWYALIVAACVSPLERFSDYNGGQVVITGQVSSIEGTSTVFVGRTSDTERLPEPITDASVILFQGSAVAGVYQPDTIVSGQYLLENFVGSPGTAYWIQVVLADGQAYQSVPEVMPLTTGKDDIHYTIERREFVDEGGIPADADFLNIYTTHTLPTAGEPVFVRWHVEEVYALSPTDFPDPFGDVPPTCYVYGYVQPQKIVLFNGRSTTASSILNLEVASRIVDASFKERHYFTLYQSSMTFEALEYWRKVDIVANQNGSVFDPPPARVKGNISNANDPAEEVLGYFQAVNQASGRFFLLPEDLPYRLTIYCEYRPERDYNNYPAPCLDCLSVKNSSYRRPPWF